MDNIKTGAPASASITCPICQQTYVQLQPTPTLGEALAAHFVVEHGGCVPEDFGEAIPESEWHNREPVR